VLTPRALRLFLPSINPKWDRATSLPRLFLRVLPPRSCVFLQRVAENRSTWHEEDENDRGDKRASYQPLSSQNLLSLPNTTKQQHKSTSHQQNMDSRDDHPVEIVPESLSSPPSPYGRAPALLFENVSYSVDKRSLFSCPPLAKQRKTIIENCNGIIHV